MSRLGKQQQRESGVRNIVSNIRHAFFKLVISIFFIIFKCTSSDNSKKYASGLRSNLFIPAAIYCYKVDKRCLNKIVNLLLNA